MGRAAVQPLSLHMLVLVEFWLLAGFFSCADGSDRLPSLSIDDRYVIAAGFDHSGSFAHQFHVAFSAMVSGACVFTGQPFYCAVSKFNQDEPTLQRKTPTTRVPFCDGCPKNMTLPFDHCVRNPNVVDVGSTVDYPRRHCGQNPINIPECFDDVDYIKDSRVFLFRGSHDKVYASGAVKNVAALLAQMMADPANSIKFVGDQPFNHILPLKSTPYAGQSTPAGYDGPGECLRHVFNEPMYEGQAIPAHWVRAIIMMSAQDLFFSSFLSLF